MGGGRKPQQKQIQSEVRMGFAAAGGTEAACDKSRKSRGMRAFLIKHAAGGGKT
jgi:hypothetical protein